MVSPRAERFKRGIARVRTDANGATAIEYALIAGLVAVVLVPGLIWVRDWQQRISETVAAKLDPDEARAVMISARSDFRQPQPDARDHQ